MNLNTYFVEMVCLLYRIEDRFEYPATCHNHVCSQVKKSKQFYLMSCLQ